jgi:hypothetical protein
MAMAELGYALSSEEHLPNDLVRYARAAEGRGLMHKGRPSQALLRDVALPAERGTRFRGRVRQARLDFLGYASDLLAVARV